MNSPNPREIAEKIMSISTGHTFYSYNETGLERLEQIEQALLSYYKERLEREFPVSGEIIQESNFNHEDCYTDCAAWIKERLIGEK